MAGKKYVHGEMKAVWELVRLNPEISSTELRVIFPHVTPRLIYSWRYNARVALGYSRPPITPGTHAPNRVHACPIAGCGRKVVGQKYCNVCRQSPDFNEKRRELRLREARYRQRRSARPIAPTAHPKLKRRAGSSTPSKPKLKRRIGS